MAETMAVLFLVLLLAVRTRRSRRRTGRLVGALLWCLLGLVALVLPGSWKPSRKPHRTASDTRPGQGPRYFAPEQRAVIFRRDGYRCRYCGSNHDLRADHKIPYSLGGKTVLENGQTLCDSCNTDKSNHWSDPGGVAVRRRFWRTR